MAEENDFVNEEIEAEETTPSLATAYEKDFFFLPKRNDDNKNPLQYVLLNRAQIEQVRAIVREEIAEAMKQLLNEPAGRLAREIVMYPEQDGM